MVERHLSDHRAEALPDVVALPPPGVAEHDRYVSECWRYLAGTLRYAGIKIVVDDRLPEIVNGVWAVRVDNELAVIDYSDYMIVPGQQADHRHWFRFQYLNSFIPHGNLSSFPPISFTDFSVWERIEPRYRATGSQILHSQSFEFLKDSPTIRDRSLYQRRQDTRAKLQAAFPQELWTEREPQQEFWQRALDCLVSVHIPGSCQHMLDRGQHQLFGLGVCTVSPEIWTSVLGDRPEAWTHYVPIRDDARDLVEIVNWCRQHREECARIGRQARAFFLTHCTPQAIWAYVKHRMATAGDRK